MTTPSRRRLIQRHQTEIDSWWDAATEGDDATTLSEAERRRNWLEAARHYDSEASLGEELTVRLQGGQAEFGALTFELGDALLKPLQDSVSAAAQAEVRLAITGISNGSTVLHVRPVLPMESEVAETQAVNVDSSVADTAVRSMLKLINAAENEEDVRRWTDMLDSVERLIMALDRHDLTMSLTWFALDGETRSGAISARGRAYFKALQEVQVEETERTVSGRVTELRESGIVKIKTGSTRKAAAFEIKVPLERLLEMHLELGQTVHFRVQERAEKDKTGRVRRTSWAYAGDFSAESRLDSDA